MPKPHKMVLLPAACAQALFWFCGARALACMGWGGVELAVVLSQDACYDESGMCIFSICADTRALFPADLSYEVICLWIDTMCHISYLAKGFRGLASLNPQAPDLYICCMGMPICRQNGP